MSQEVSTGTATRCFKRFKQNLDVSNRPKIHLYQRIDDGSELFGNHTLLADGSKANNGFEALQALDNHANGQIYI